MKPKNDETELTNHRLAQAFNFTANDLAINRSGYMTRAQAWSLPIWMQKIWRVVGKSFNKPKRKISERLAVKMICGKVHTISNLHEVHGGRFQIDFRSIQVNDIKFRVTPQQLQAITSETTYRIYAHPETGDILSLEQVPTC